MRKINKCLIYIVALSFVLFFGCKEDNQNTLSASPVRIDFQKEGGSASLMIQTDADSWNINDFSDWFVLSSTNGTGKTAAVALNVNTKTIESRTDTVTITAGNAKPVQVIVSQPASDFIYTLSVDSPSLSFKKAGEAINVTISTDAPQWNISSDVTWLQFSPVKGIKGDSTVTIIASENPGAASRSAMISISAEYAPTVQIPVSQASFIYTLKANSSSLSFKQAGSSATVIINTDAPQWNLTSNADWLQFSQVTGNNSNTTVTVTALENITTALRSGMITINAQSAPTVQISVSQKGRLYPNYNTSPVAPDAIGMNCNASELAAKINLGWNIGNTLEAIGGETAWGNPRVTKAFIDFVKQSGFNAIRIPCSWNQYLANSSTAQIKTDWLNRVKEVVQYCVDNDMYVLLNIHWDGGWLENNCTTSKQEENNAKQRAFWEQIATHLRDFDEHLLLASANEPNVENATQMAVLKSYHQTFIDAVRSTGGKNSYRILVIQGPSTDIEKTNKLMLSLPTDQIAKRLMIEVHYYTPWNFCGMTKDESWGKMFYYWGKDYHSTTDLTRNPTWGEEATVDANFKLMKNQFVDKGIPVILGEYAAVRRSELTGNTLTLHLASRAYFLKYVTKQAKANGILPFYWDNGGTGTNGCAIFYRDTNTVFDQQALNALIQGATP